MKEVAQVSDRKLTSTSIKCHIVQQIAKDKDCSRMVWQVLDWNTRALELYERIGGQCEKEWLTVRMYEPKITEFAGSS